MLNKNFDFTMVGKSYLSMLFSMEFMDWGQSTLIIDDERLQFGPLYSGILGHMDLCFLEIWGEDRGIKPLVNIRKYVKPSGLSLYMDGRWVLLGNSPSMNLQELIRKFPHLFGYINESEGYMGDNPQMDVFNESYNGFCQRMAENCFRFRTLQNLNIQSFLSLCPRDLLERYKVFKSHLDKNKQLENIPLHQKMFLYLSRGFIQKKLSMRGNDLELFHLLVTLLSPTYILDEKSLANDLEPVFKEKGGQLKKATVREWLFDKNKPWSLELSSYEGIIHPKRIALMGGRPEKMPIQVAIEEKSFRNIEIEFNLEEKNKEFFSNGYFVYTESTRIGGHFPYWTMTKSAKGLSVSLYTLVRKGMKISFLKDKALTILAQDLEKILGHRVDICLEKISFGREICIEDNVGEKSFPNILNNVQVLDTSSPGEGSRLKNVYYFGPLKKGSLGLFSTLMEIKEGIRVV